MKEATQNETGERREGEKEKKLKTKNTKGK